MNDNLTNSDRENQTDSELINNLLSNKITKWKEKLIDLTKRNRLLNFKSPKNASIKIIDEMPVEIFSILVSKSKKMSFLPIHVQQDQIPEEYKLSKEELNKEINFKTQEFSSYDRKFLEKKHTDTYLQTNLSGDVLSKTLRKINTTAKNAMNDLGYNTLFLTLGSVEWYESDDSEVKYEAPLILLPTSLARENMNDSFKIEYNDDDIILNPALLLLLKKDFSINLDDLKVEEFDDNTIYDIFETVQSRIAKKKRWKLCNNIYLGLFSFAKFVMYKDLEEHSDEIRNCSLVKNICGLNKSQRIDIEQTCPIKELDKNFLPQDNYSILDADSSQQQAIAFVKQNNNLVIQGPPGTGKSQTIANIIAELLSQGKKVLFVSQKIAALEVVQNRLAKNGLSPYCLELHSNKINKKNVLQNIVNTIYETGEITHTGSNLDVLQRKRIELNEYDKTLHTHMGKLQKTPFDAIGTICLHKNIPDLEFIFEDFEQIDKETFELRKAIFSNLKHIVKNLGNPKYFSWYGTKLKNLDSDYQKKLEIKSKLKNLSELLINLSNNTEELTNYLCLKKVETFNDLQKLLDIADIFLNIPNNLFENLNQTSEEKISKDINKICECITNFNLYNNAIKEHYSLNIINDDLDLYINLFKEYSKSPIKKFSINYLKSILHLKKFFISQYKPTTAQIYEDLKNLKHLKCWLKEIDNCNPVAEKLFNNIWEKENTQTKLLTQSSDNVFKMKSLLKSDTFTEDIITKFTIQSLNQNFIDKLSDNIKACFVDIKQTFSDLCELTLLDIEDCFSCEFQDLKIELLQNKILAMLQDIDDLTIWNQYLIALDEVKENNLNAFYNKFLESKIDFDYIDTTFEVQFLRTWLNCFVYPKTKILRDFNTEQHNLSIKQFKELDKNMISSAKLRLLEILQNNMINGTDNYPEEFFDLEHESNLQRLRKSLRQIISMIPNLLLAIKPCLMMSPLTVSQLLDPDLFKFDYVIFDEASQLTTEDCIGSMIRCKRLIVAGDEQQLPPTSFFKSVTEVSEEEFTEDEKEDLESILAECQTSNFPKCMLKWHYRSKDEHLIAFSNKHLYRELYTFPSSIESSEITGIKWHYNPILQSEGNNALMQEAQNVAQAVIAHAKKFPDKTCAVATFNVKQKSMIEDAINELLKKEKDCVDFFDDKKIEPFFVKNVESVQGDERDVIFISMGTFKNQNGVLDMRSFGPVNRDGGERRLNVLVTRARYKIELFSAIRYGDFKEEKLTSDGVKLLKKYLEYAERGEVALISDTKTQIDDSFDSPFEKGVCEELRKAGLNVSTQIGCSGYKIDLAVRDDKNPGEFILGIECDGITYHSSATARDRDRLREEILKNLGWKIYRIWSTDWFKNPQRVMTKLLKYINDLKISKELNQDGVIENV